MLCPELEKLEPVMGPGVHRKDGGVFLYRRRRIRQCADAGRLYTQDYFHGGRGQYVPSDLDPDAGSSTMNMEMEAFYEAVKDADYLIYSGTIEGELESLEQFLDKSSI